MAKDLAAFIRQKATAYGERIFLRDSDTGDAVTYQLLDVLTDRIAQSFRRLGLMPDDRVALLHPNHSDFILCYFSVIKAGGVAVAVNPVYPPPEIAYIVHDSGASMLVTTGDLLPTAQKAIQDLPGVEKTIVKQNGQGLEQALEQALAMDGETTEALSPCPERSPDDPALLFYTSGTTGKPKGVIITHQNLTFSGPNVAQSYGLREEDVTIAALPLVHVFANASPVFGSLSSGGTVVVMERFQTEAVFDAIERWKVTWFPGVPTMFHYMLAGYEKTGRNLASLRMLLSGGASLSVEVLRALEEKFNTKVLEVYGLTESTGLVTANPVFGERKPGSIGVVVSGVDARVVNSEDREVSQNRIGELIFRGPNACRGYWNLPEQSAEAIRHGWVHTGDHAYKDEDGYYFIVGREKELIITGGYNVYPREIEEVLYMHPDVHEAAVIGAGHPQKGEIPKACVVLHPGADTDAAALQDHCRQHMAPYKVPAVVFMEELPKNPTGKIMKNRLK